VLFGAGGQGAAQIEAILELVPSVVDLAIVGRRPETVQGLLAQFNDPRVRSSAGDHDLRAADVIVLATSASTPVLRVTQLCTPVLVVALGSNRPDHRELDADIVARADAIYVDDLETARAESGDLILAGADWSRVELLPVTPGAARQPFALFESHGLAAFDLVCADFVYRRVLEEEQDDQFR
jgi:ornithine cyclodeaminase/alanine dehydrogenase-like protein (mu-crystallin family)